MRLWHQDLLPILPTPQLGGQHRECCALRGLGWGKLHSTVNYVFSYDPIYLYEYHMLVIQEKNRRYHYGYDNRWLNPLYRGLNSVPWEESQIDLSMRGSIGDPIYKQHDLDYLIECIRNLVGKGYSWKLFLTSDGILKSKL